MTGTKPIPKNLRGLFHEEWPRRDTMYRATGEFRPPKKGEWYLSGAIVQAYQAPNDLSTPYWIAVPIAVTVEKCPHCQGTGRVVEVVKEVS